MAKDFSESFRELNGRFIHLLDSFSALSALSSLELRNVDEPTMLRNALKGLMQNLDIETCSIFLLKDGQLVNSTGLSWDDLVNGEEASALKTWDSSTLTASIGEGIMGLAVKNRALQHCRDCSADSRFKEVPDQEIGSLISIPIFQMGGEVLGVLNISHTKPHFFTEWHERFLSVYCHCFGQLLSNYRLLNHMELEIERRIEERKKLEAQLLHAQKMEAIGLLAGGVAHDFNNIITAITGYAHLLSMRMDADDPLRHFSEQIIASSERAANLTQGLLAFSRKQVINPQPVNVNEIIKRVEKLLRRLIGEDIALGSEICDSELFVMADKGQLEQIMINLATNARDAMPDGGELTISTGHEEITDDFIKAHGFGAPGEYVCVSVTDTGIGMDEKTREKIFEPFYTTKEVGKGTGLGLAIVYGIVSQQNGYITVSSGPGEGTSFRIYLPAIEGRAEEAVSEEHVLPASGSETLLIAEDDDDVRKFDAAILEQFGYRVLTAVDGADALRIFADHKDVIDLAILDVVMPMKNGKEVHDVIQKIRPGARVLFTSGYTADIINRKGVMRGEFEFIEKPHSPLELLKKVRDVLDGM
jgi:signal transduction histidine kinase